MIKEVLYSVFIAAVVILVGCSNSQSPSSAYREMVQAEKNQNWGKVYDSYCESSQEKVVEMFKSMQALSNGLFSMLTDGENEDSAGQSDNEQLSGRDFFVKTMTSGQDISSNQIGKVIDEKITGDRAVLTIELEKDEDDPRSAFMDDTVEVGMVLENGRWKIVLE
ncbi:hypothetical protein CHISP_3241 [Chitinispirillum alkaliphilum]|nr:hypothetical protein CHISP_3241 [Chitinispirillum alkaliphilum]